MSRGCIRVSIEKSSNRLLKKGRQVAGTIPVLAQRAASEGPRWTRAVGIIPATPYQAIVCCGLACGTAHFGALGWAGEKLAFLSSLPFGISYPLFLLSECDVAFSLPPVRKSVVSNISCLVQ